MTSSDSPISTGNILEKYTADADVGAALVMSAGTATVSARRLLCVILKCSAPDTLIATVEIDAAEGAEFDTTIASIPLVAQAVGVYSPDVGDGWLAENDLIRVTVPSSLTTHRYVQVYMVR